MTKKLLLFFTALYLHSLLSLAQQKEIQFKHISTSDGLSQSSAIAICQDNLGQMWIGTRDGLNKYDGNSFTVYRNNTLANSISNNDVLSIIQDRDGDIWIGTYNGLNRYSPQKNVFTTFFKNNGKNSLCNNTILAIKELSNGEIWIGTSNGLSVYNKSKNCFTNFFHQDKNENSIANNRVNTILETSKKEVFVGTTKGLSKVVSRENNKILFKTVHSKILNVQDVIEEENHLLLATKQHGVLVYNASLNTIKEHQVNAKIYKNVRRLLYDNQRNLWVGTYNGLFIITPKNKLITLKNNVNDTKSLSKNSVKSLFKDKKGSIWVGTYYGGINFWDQSNSNFINYTTSTFKKRLSYSVVSSIEKYKNKYLFFGTEGNGVDIFNIQKNTVLGLYKNIKLQNKNVKSLLVDNDLLWIGSFSSGIRLYDIKEEKEIRSPFNSSLKSYLDGIGVYSIKKEKNTYWLGTFGKGLIHYNRETNAFKTYVHDANNSNSLSNDLIRTIKIDSKNNIWVGTQEGLNKITPSNTIVRFFYNSEIQSGDDITSVFEDSKQTIWVGTKAKGLYKLKGDAFQKVELATKNTSISSIHSILEDDDSTIWVSTNQGIISYHIIKNEIGIYNQKEGIISNEFNDNASLKFGKSTMYFGGPDGITSFNTSAIKNNNYSPQVILTDFKIKNKSIKIDSSSTVLKNTIQYTDQLSLTHDQGNFSISFAIPNFINSKNNTYKYRLRGLEEDWVFTSGNSATYTIQNPGKYIFEIKGANNNEVWNTNATELEINVSPAPWRSWWAFLLYGLAIAVALYFLIDVQKSKTKLKLELGLEQLENEKIEETNKAKLQFFTNISHEFRTPLTLILGPLKQVLGDFKGASAIYKKLLVVENNANHLLLLINRLMDFRKFENDLFKVEAAEGNIVKFLREIYLSFSEHAKSGDFEYTFSTSEEVILVYYDRYKLERVFYNLISNAFRYTPKGGKIHFTVKRIDNLISIAVEDSGVGISKENKDKIFDRFFEVAINNEPGNTYTKGTGIGLSIAKNIVKLHKGSINVKDNTNGKGTIFTVQLPLGKNHFLEEEIIKDFKFSDDVSQYVDQLKEPVLILEDKLSDAIVNPAQETILIVEDNKPLRKFMKQLLVDDYNVIEAENGEIALKKAIKHSPNLIVSDVIMPVMVGTELCAAIKKNIKTSHIPIILLTSRTSLIYRLDGLENGADDYISKPFDVKEFKLRIRNILETQQKLREKFTGDLKPNSSDVVSSMDEKLFKKALGVVHTNIANEDFDIPFFCSELGVSRTMLFVKIKAWTNFTPNEFILHLRMKRAAELLEKGQLNISQISYKVGYKNPKYFSKSFQKKYGESPSQYQKKFSEY
jgi:signal transduction histidine kinase/ligand-binding sensor domain-containing protein/DNA-binding response OmpR family regulator